MQGAVDFGSIAEGCFEGCSALTTIDLSMATFPNVANARRMFYGCSALTTMDLSSATFANVTTFEDAFGGCSALTLIDLSSATFAELTTFGGYQHTAFYNLQNLQEIRFSNSVTFPKLTTTQSLFMNCYKLVSVNLQSATFPLVTLIGGNATASGMFQDCRLLETIDLSSAIFGEVQYANGFAQGCNSLKTLKLSAATLAKAIRTTNFCNSTLLSTIDVPQNSTAILKTSSASNAPMDLRTAPLDYASMLKVANWLSDLTGQSAHTLTFKASGWNALSSAEQTNIDNILSGKNWTRAIA